MVKTCGGCFYWLSTTVYNPDIKENRLGVCNYPIPMGIRKLTSIIDAIDQHEDDFAESCTCYKHWADTD